MRAFISRGYFCGPNFCEKHIHTYLVKYSYVDLSDVEGYYPTPNSESAIIFATLWQESHLPFLGSSVPYSSLSRDDTLIPRQTEFRAFLDVSQVGAGCGLLGLAVARLAQLGLRNGEFESCFAQSFWILVAFFNPNHQKTYGCFQKRGYPQLIHFDRVFHYKPIHFGFFPSVFGNTHIINRSNI